MTVWISWVSSWTAFRILPEAVAENHASGARDIVRTICSRT